VASPDPEWNEFPALDYDGQEFRIAGCPPAHDWETAAIADTVLIARNDEAGLAVATSGGCVLSYTVGRFDILRPLDGPANGPFAPGDTASFPLVPYSNRIRDGRFAFNGRDYRLPLNFGDHPHSIHGVGWQARWTLADRSDDAILLGLDHDGEGWPFAFRATQSFALEGATLRQEMSITNTSGGPAPAGLGFHPYLPRHRGARLTADVAGVWLTDGTCLPTARVPCPEEWDLRRGAYVDALGCDNQFEPWDGQARIVWPADGMAVDLAASADLDRLVVYAPPGEDFFCVEPVSHMTDAVNHAARGLSPDAAGLRVLEDGETWTVWMRLSPARIP
jgi:aldose 1-epimerase